MSRRLAVLLLSLALIAMSSALAWMFREMMVSVEVPPMAEMPAQPVRKPVTKPAPQVPATFATPSTTAVDNDRPLAETIAEALLNPEAVPGEALLTFKNAAALAAFRARAAQAGLDIISIDPTLLTARVRYRSLDGLQKDLAEHASDYTNAGPNLIARIPGLPAQPQKDTANAGGSTPFRSQGLDLIGAPANRTGWGSGVTVAVLDSGVVDHPSLRNASITHIDLVEDGQAFHGHGTAMTSLIAGDDPNIAGISPASKIIDIRVADPQGNSNTALLASGIVRAIESGAKVINISLGSSQTSPVLEQAVQYAISRGAVIIAAAGNEQSNALSYPAGYSGVVSVAAIDANGAQAWFSNSGQGLTLAAPGVGIVSAYTANKLVIGSGTSQATAITSGVAAYLAGRGYLPANIPTVLIRSARPTGAAQTAVGAGILRIP